MGNDSNDLQQHMFAMAPLSTWAHLLRDNERISRPYWGKLAVVLLTSTLTTPLRMVERLRFASQVRETSIDTPPLIILGYGRSGTTHLHNLLTQDPNHGSVTTFQAIIPSFFLTGRGRIKRLMSGAVPARRPMDNVRVTLDAPQEEEIAIANLTHHSFLHHLSFPQQSERYFKKYMLMQGLTAAELAQWDQVYLDVVRKATLHADGRRIVLKSPSNLGRIPHLLRLFPGAKFVHIVRNPYVVYPSMMHMYRKIMPPNQLQQVSWSQMEAHIEDFYASMMQQYLRDRALIPAGNLTEVRFERLEQDPLGEIERIYRDLALPGWEAAHRQMEAYLRTLSAYRKNSYPLDPAVIDRVEKKWRFALDAWHYQLPDNNKNARS
jgi:hypothetical protein